MKARINPDTQTWEYGPNEMPARKGWLPFVETAAPTVTSNQIAHVVDPVVNNNTVVMTWAIRDKTQQELHSEIDAAEIVQAKAAYRALLAGTGTNLVRLERLERVLARVMKELWGLAKYENTT